MRGLAQQLSRRGYASAIAAPTFAAAGYEDVDLAVYRFAADPRRRLALAYGVPDQVAAEGFRYIVERIRPRIVHLHARTAAVSERLVDVAHALGARVVYTYHTPTASCARGTMMLFGKEPCDGVIEIGRCTACTLAALGAPMPLARLASYVPAAVTSAISTWDIESKPLSALRIPGLVASSGQRFHDFIGKVEHVVAVCQWVKDVLIRNGVSPAKITLSRQGISNGVPRHQETVASDIIGPIRIAYFGRVNHAKGPDLLARALNRVPTAHVQIDIYAVHEPGSEDYLAWLKSQGRQDGRLRVLPTIPPDEVKNVMVDYDLIAIPSRWLETGPLVALEAFAAGVPVLGAKLGGIAELVRDGVDGVLVAPDDPVAWAAAIAHLASNREVLRNMRASISPPRSMEAVADDMVSIYASLLVESAIRTAAAP